MNFNSKYSKWIGLAVAIIVIGAFFRIQHWANGREISLVGFVVLGCLGVIRLLDKRKRGFSFILSSMLILLYSLMGILRIFRISLSREVMIMLFLTGAVWLVTYILKFINRDEQLHFSVKSILYFTGAILIIIGALIKMMHWPGSSILLFSGMGIGAVSFLVRDTKS